MSNYRRLYSCLLACTFPAGTPLMALEPQLLWGDTHLHSSYSADAYLSGNFSADPDTAYRYAKGLPVVHPFHGARVQIGTPLDFLVVSDHAEFLGGIRSLHRGEYDTSDSSLVSALVQGAAAQMFRWLLADGDAMSTFDDFSAQPGDPGERAATLMAQDAPGIPGQAGIMTSAWRDIAQIADDHNSPGEFSALIGWEWTATPGGANLHRVVFTDADAGTAAHYLPYSRDDSPYPEDLWRWLQAHEDEGHGRFVSIPHNSNISKGYMFPPKTLRGQPFDENYLALRQRMEPVVEATQFKGDSETHPQLSPADSFADFERFGFYIQAYPTSYEAQPGDFVRHALLRGLTIGASQGINPYRLGMIGSTDSHTGLASAEEDNFHGKLAPNSIPQAKPGPTGGPGSATGWDMSASGLAAVWAKDNTRAAILDAFRRREVYATTGPRIQVRVAACWTGFAATVPMGALLPARPADDALPVLQVTAMKDAVGANLDRIQVIKGWVDESGASRERIYNAAWSGARMPGGDGTLEHVGNTVDATRASYDNSVGEALLTATWTDRAFDPGQAAFYYIRVLEIPTPRHSTFDAVALGETLPEHLPPSIQERAYTSPVWYEPGD